MNTKLDVIKGIHPGIILDRELKQRKLRKGQFALAINEFPQTLGSITKGKRRMNIPLALKIEQALQIEEGYFMILQVFYDIEEEKRKRNTSQPNLSLLRKVLFWDTNIEKINWEKQKRSVIKRVFERGNEVEKKEITRFYGKECINEVLLTHAS